MFQSTYINAQYCTFALHRYHTSSIIAHDLGNKPQDIPSTLVGLSNVITINNQCHLVKPVNL